MPLLRYSYRGTAAVACIAKYQPACLPAFQSVCHFAHLCISVTVQPACHAACFAIFSPPLCHSPRWLLPHVSEAIILLLRPLLFISPCAWVCRMDRACRRVCRHVFVPRRLRIRVCVCVCAMRVRQALCLYEAAACPPVIQTPLSRVLAIC